MGVDRRSWRSRWRTGAARTGAPRFGRTLVVGGLSVLLTIGAATFGGSSAGADTTTFTNGKGQAVAQVLRVAPGVGNLSLAMAAGVAVSDISNSLGEAEAQTLDTGLIGSTLTGPQCDGSKPALTPEDLPQPTQVDNRSGAASKVTDYLPLAGSSIGGGHQEAAANGTPQAAATVSGVAATLGPVVSLSGGRSEATTGVIDGKAREAEATVSVDLDIAGAIKLRGLKWDAVHRTGADPHVDGTFTIAEGDVGSIPLPIDQLGSLQDQLNKLLSATGLSIELPHVERLTAPNDLVRVTPLRITLRDSPLGKAVLGPVLNLTRTQREQLFDQILGLSCKAASSVLVGDVALDVASGTGFLIAEIGGVEATSAAVTDGNPFGTDAPLTAAPDLPSVAAAPLPSPSLVTPPPALVTSAAAPVAQTVAATGPIEQVCESLSGSRHRGCTHGMGVPIGIAGLALTGGIAFLDWRRQRRLAAAGTEVPA